MNCQHVFEKSRTICGSKTEGNNRYCRGHEEGRIRSEIAYRPIVELAKSMSEEEALAFRDWVVESLETLGMDHQETCDLNVPHSHSADCTCGADELTEKILRFLERSVDFTKKPAPATGEGSSEK